ncbi:MAG: KamA family radical SAM protein [Verrucomicrobiota bacterium]|nr:KamA family radical SAM protein [Verrucomicrobiota bacterium]
MSPLWRQIQRQTFTSVAALADFLELPPLLQKRLLVRARFPLRLPYRLAEKIEKKTLDDPLLRQFVPLMDEEMQNSGFCADPVQDQQFRKAKKLLHKYQGRALLLATSACAMHCRFCFRQHFPYETDEPSFTQELQYLSEDSSISEVILSGGDPLSLGDERLDALLSALAKIPHVRRIRFHTRFPIGIPERIDDSLIQILQKVDKQIYFVLHINHPREVDTGLFAFLRRLLQIGIPLLSQTVLLKGVNDDLEVLVELFESLVDGGIIPYYLHELDPVEGGAHFFVAKERERELVQALQARLPGYAVPRWVREEPGKAHKIILTEQ